MLAEETIATNPAISFRVESFDRRLQAHEAVPDPSEMAGPDDNEQSKLLLNKREGHRVGAARRSGGGSETKGKA
jgi:hypothetical protein